uniref:Secreted protein n=1 Tax=Heterorhabditis bacteriophora TaxID=37862 RepID=A0A1I7WXK0_HETBA
MSWLILVFWIPTIVFGTISYEDGTVTEDLEIIQALPSSEKLGYNSPSCCKDATIETANYIIVS